jgi:hypothetical protein
MQRRTFLQALFGLPALPLLRPHRQPAPPAARVTYTDSEGRQDTDLRALHDGDTLTGGVEYLGN